MAAAGGAKKIPMRELSKKLTLRVEITGLRGWAVRQWIAIQLCRLAARVMGTGFEVSSRSVKSTARGTRKR